MDNILIVTTIQSRVSRNCALAGNSSRRASVSVVCSAADCRSSWTSWRRLEPSWTRRKPFIICPSHYSRSDFITVDHGAVYCVTDSASTNPVSKLPWTSPAEFPGATRAGPRMHHTSGAIFRIAILQRSPHRLEELSKWRSILNG